MIISRSPFRISFFGGGTDYPAWFRERGGAVLGAAIDKYCYVSARCLPPFFEHKHRIVWSKIELVRETSEIRHPAVRATLQASGIRHGVEVSYNSDLPARSGLGTSSSFTVGLIHAFAAMKGMRASKQELAAEAIRIEQDVLKEAVGSQDQVWAAFGGFNRIDFSTDGSYEVSPVILSRKRRDELEGALMLFFSGFARDAQTIAKKQIQNMDKRVSHLTTLRRMVDEASHLLHAQEFRLAEFGALLDESWALKRELADGVTTPLVDEIYQSGRTAGAVGGKLLGAGGGGFILFVVPPDRQQQVRERLKRLVHVNFRFDTSGSKIITYDPDEVVYG